MRSQARPDSHDGVTRRELLKRAAVAGSVAWAAPVIHSITTPAFAQATPGCIAGCFWVKWDPTEPCVDVSGQSSIKCSNCLADEGLTQDRGGCPCIENAVTTQPCGDPATGTWTLTLPPGCTFHGGGSKCASDLCQPAMDNGDGTVTFFPCLDASGNPKCISHIEFCYCSGV